MDEQQLPPLPEGWRWTTIGEVSHSPQYGWTTSAAKTGALKLLRTTDITSGHIDWDRVPFCEDEPKEKEKYLLRDGDIVVSRAGSIGYSYLVRNPQLSVFASYLIRFRPLPDIDDRYMAYFLQSPFYWREVYDHQVGIAIPNINASKLRQIPLPLAPLSEQQRIVEVIETQLTRLDAGVAALERAKAGLKRYRAAILKAACEGKLVPTEAELARSEGRDYEPADQLLRRILAERRSRWEAEHPGKKYQEPVAPDRSELGELPEGWCWVNVEQIGNVQLGRQRSPKNHQGPYMRPYLRAANATWRGVDLSDVMEMNFSPEDFERYKLRNGDILLSEASGSASEVGKPFIWREQISDCCFQNTLIRVQAFTVFPEFLYIRFLTDALIGGFGLASQGINIQHLGAGRMSKHVIGLPPLAEQARIVVEVERHLSIIAAMEKAVAEDLTRAARLRQAILREAFAGRL